MENKDMRNINDVSEIEKLKDVIKIEKNRVEKGYTILYNDSTSEKMTMHVSRFKQIESLVSKSQCYSEGKVQPASNTASNIADPNVTEDIPSNTSTTDITSAKEEPIDFKALKQKLNQSACDMVKFKDNNLQEFWGNPLNVTEWSKLLNLGWVTARANDLTEDSQKAIISNCRPGELRKIDDGLVRLNELVLLKINKAKSVFIEKEYRSRDIAHQEINNHKLGAGMMVGKPNKFGFVMESVNPVPTINT